MYPLKVKNRINFIVLNIIFSDFLISSLGIFVDIMGILQIIGTSLSGRKPENILCQFEGLFYMTVGEYKYLYLLKDM